MRSTAVLREAVDALARVDVDALSAYELQALIADVGPQVDRLQGVVSAAVAALHVRTGGSVVSAPGPDGAPGPVVATRHWLRDILACGGSAAGAHVRTALDLRSLPLVEAAVRDGVIKAEQARILTRLIEPIGLAQLLDCQRELVQIAAAFDPAGLAAWVRERIATWCEPQLEHDNRTAQAKRYLQTREQGNGTTRGSFLLPTQDLEAFHTVLESLARSTGLSDQRTAAQRRADALLDVFGIAARAAGLPDAGGLPTQVHYVVPADWAAQTEPLPFADTLADDPVPGGTCAVGVWTGPQTRSRIETVLCDSRITRVLLSPAGQVTALESLTGEITRAQRRALIARDHGCIARGCTRPPAFCDAHHLRHREDGGDTCLDNLVQCEAIPWAARRKHRPLKPVFLRASRASGQLENLRRGYPHLSVEV